MRPHWNKKVEKVNNQLFDKYNDKTNLKYINNLILDAYLVFFDRFELYI